MTQHKSAIIIGGGVAGPAVALSLTRVGIKCTVYELREGPATIGGAINLTPNALRFLDYVGILEDALKLGCPTEVIEVFSIATGKRLGDLPFGSKARHGYSSLRIGRTDLQNMMLDAAREAGVEIHFSKKLVGVEENEDSITATFEDGTSATGDFLVGCDGIHSVVRKTYVEPNRQPTYTGISSAYGMAPTSAITNPIHFSAAAINSSCNGSLLTTYCNAEKTYIYVAAVMEVSEHQGADGWRIKGKVAEETREHLLCRFDSEKLPCIKEMTSSTEDLFFYPVFTLPKAGLWHRGRALLIGDASHAMPPGGHSVGLACEDAVLIARLIEHVRPTNIHDVFPRFAELRAPRIDKDYTEAEQRWEGVKTVSWWWQMLREYIYWIFIGLFARHVDKSFGYDIFKQEL